MKISTSDHVRLLIAAGSMILYAVSFPIVYSSVGHATAALNAIPAVAFGWFLGTRGGVFYAFIAIPVNTFLFWLVGDTASTELGPTIIGSIAFTVASVGFGWVHDLNNRLHTQADALQAERTLLQEEIVRRTRAEAKLAHEALHDPLTNLPNRRLFFHRLEHAFAWSKRNLDTFCAVLYLDLNRFKTINDSLGHDAGDHLLVQVAARLKASVRAIDTVARMGGDEFAIVLEAAATPDDVHTIIQRMQVSLAQPYEWRGTAIVSGASIGVVMSLATYEQMDRILEDADIAMYRAKACGSNQVKVFEAGMRS